MPYIAWGVTTLAAAFFGSYLGGYLKRKGENLATHEDIKKLVEQVRAVTTATKEIEAKISSDVWDRQKRWEMKREVVFEAIKIMARLDAALRSVNVAFEIEHEPNDPEWLNAIGIKAMHFLDTSAEFEGLGMLVATICEGEAIRATRDFARLSKSIAGKISNGDKAVYESSVGELTAKANAVRNAFRRELGMDNKC